VVLFSEDQTGSVAFCWLVLRDFRLVSGELFSEFLRIRL
jgi:hypothetical protein